MTRIALKLVLFPIRIIRMNSCIGIALELLIPSPTHYNPSIAVNSLMKKLPASFRPSLAQLYWSIAPLCLVLWIYFLPFNPPAKIVSVTDGDLTVTLQSNRSTIGEVLRDNGIAVYNEDRVVPPMENELHSNQHIYIERSKEVKLTNFIGQTQIYRTRAHNIALLLQEIGYEAKEGERVIPSWDTEIENGLEIRMLLQTEENYEHTVKIPHEVKRIFDDELLFDKTIVEQKGQDGEKYEKYLLVYEDDKLIEKTLLEEKVLSEPVTEVIRLGRKIPPNETFEIGSGKASFYGRAFDGRRTASGETFLKDAFTAAHKELPFGTMVRVTNLANSKSVIVKINDRGPYVDGRVIDLSEAAFSTIGKLSTGVLKVKLEVLGQN